MKLLLPRERVSLEQQEQERLVKEQTAISTHVDELRELEQAQIKKLQDFQEREFRKYQADVEKRNGRLADLDRQIEAKQAEIESYFGPLDNKWALYKKVEKAKIEDEQARQAQIATDLFLKGQEQAIKDEELRKTAKNLDKRRSEILSLSETVQKDKMRIEDEMKDTRRQVSALYEEAEQAKKNAIALENQAQVKLREIELRDEMLDMREKELEDRETQVLVKELQYYSPVKKSYEFNSKRSTP